MFYVFTTVADWAAHKLVCDDIALAIKQGVLRKVVTEGKGKSPKKGQKVTVHYTGMYSCLTGLNG